MRDIALLTFLTLDGVMQGPSMPEEDPSGGFDRGGWAAPYWAGVMAQVQREAMAQPYDMLFGRKTYQMFAGHWPNAPESPEGEMMNAAQKYVVSGQGCDLTWGPAALITGDVKAGLRALKAQDGPLLQVHGSGKLGQWMLSAGLVDELRLWTFPVTVGAGRRLFGETGAAQGWRLTKSEAGPEGVVMSILRRED